MCEQKLIKTLSIENVIEILILSDTHCAHQLKKHAIRFFIYHKTDVIKTSEWKRLVKERPSIIVEAFEIENSSDKTVDFLNALQTEL